MDHFIKPLLIYLQLFSQNKHKNLFLFLNPLFNGVGHYEALLLVVT